MNRKRYSALILAIALIIIGMRGVCMAQFSQHVSIEKSDTQISDLVDEQNGVGFTFRVKRYVVPSPSLKCFAGEVVIHRIYGIKQDVHVNPDKSCKSCEIDRSEKPPLRIKQ